MKNSYFSHFKRLFAAALVLGALLFTGCVQPNNGNHGDVFNTWVSTQGDKFVITSSALTNFYGDKKSYSGNELTVDEESETSGTIFIKYTGLTEYAYTDPEDSSWTKITSSYGDYWSRYSETADGVGKWTAVRYQDLTSTAVVLILAYKNGGKSYTDSIYEARKEFTVANGYFSPASTPEYTLSK